jgi:hypothetical protein
MQKLIIVFSIISLTFLCIHLEAQISYPGNETATYYDPGMVGTSQVSPSIGVSYRSSDFLVNFIGNWPPEAMAAFNYAVSIWEHHLTSSVPITVDARFEPLATSPVFVLGSAGTTQYWVNAPNSPGDPFPKDGTAYPAALANKFAEEDLNVMLADINARFTTDGALATQGLSWNFDHNHPPDVTQIDFVTVVLHELGHGIMGSTSAQVSMSGVGSLGNGIGGNPTIFDTFVSGCTTLIPITSMPNNSVALGNALTGSDLCFLDEFGNAPCTAGGNPPKLYAPNPFEPASSIVHLNDATYPPGNVNSLMTPFAGAGEQILQVGDLFLCMLDQLGWMVDFTTGIEDDIAITTWPNFISQGQNFEFWAAFYDEEPYGDYILSNTHEWKIEPLYNDGFYPLLVTQSTMAWHYWPDQLPYLPFLVNQSWSRNPDGTIRTKATISADDNSGFFHLESVDIGIPYAPDQPVIQSDYLGCYEVKLSFYSPGATSYEIYYDTDPGVPYNGTGLPQGNSPIIVNGNTNSITLTNLKPQSYYFNVRGKNNTGYSTYAIEEYEQIPIEERDCGGVIFINGCVPESGAILDVSNLYMDDYASVSVHLINGDNIAKYYGIINSTTINLANLDATLNHDANTSSVQISDGGFYTVRLSYPKNGFYNLQESHFEVSNSLICNRSSTDQEEGEKVSNDDIVFNIIPNPVQSFTTFNTGLGSEYKQGRIKVLNHYGVTLWEIKIDNKNSTVNFDTSDLPAGMYFVQLKADNVILANKRLIVVK